MIEYSRSTKDRLKQAAVGLTTAAVGAYSLVITMFALADGMETVSSSSSRHLNSQRWAVERVVPFGLAEDIIVPQDSRSFRSGIDALVTLGGGVTGLPLTVFGLLHTWNARRKIA